MPVLLAFLIAACSGGTAPATATPAGAAASPSTKPGGPSSSAGSAAPSGQTLDALSQPGAAPDAYVAGSNTTLSAAADVPPGYTGTAIQASITDLPAGTDSANTRAITLDLSGSPDDSTVKVWIKASTLTNLHTVHVIFRSGTGWAAFGTVLSEAGTWQELALPKGSPSSSDAMDWRAVSAITLRAEATPGGNYTGQVLWRDLRLTH